MEIQRLLCSSAGNILDGDIEGEGSGCWAGSARHVDRLAQFMAGKEPTRLAILTAL